MTSTDKGSGGPPTALGAALKGARERAQERIDEILSMGIKEQIVFPEIEYDKIDKIRGMDITITTTAKTDEEGRALLEAFNFPLKR